MTGRFYLGLHQPRDAAFVDRAFISANRLREREGGFLANEWVMDSGAFTEVTTHGRYRAGVGEYAALIRRFAGCGELVAAVAQDFMCEPFALKATGLTVAEHQRLTIERYRDLIACDTAGVYIMPVLQGQLPADYVRHLDAYGDLIDAGAWIGVGSVCKRQGSAKSSAYLGAFTSEEWSQQDDDFKDNYMAGRYDRPCYDCSGLGRLQVIDAKACTGWRSRILLKAYRQQQRDLREVDAIQAAERRMGA